MKKLLYSECIFLMLFLGSYAELRTFDADIVSKIRKKTRQGSVLQHCVADHSSSDRGHTIPAKKRDISNTVGVFCSVWIRGAGYHHPKDAQIFDHISDIHHHGLCCSARGRSVVYYATTSSHARLTCGMSAWRVGVETRQTQSVHITGLALCSTWHEPQSRHFMFHIIVYWNWKLIRDSAYEA